MKDFSTVRNLMLANHSMLFCFLFWNSNSPENKFPGVKTGLNFGLMLYSIYTLLKISQLNYYAPYPMNAANNDTMNAIYWLRIVMQTEAAIIFSNMLFLATRFCVKNKLYKEKWHNFKYRTIQVDTLVALQDVANAFHNEVVPLIITSWICYSMQLKHSRMPMPMPMEGRIL